MIYTLTVSPSIDYVNKIEDFKIGIINRSNDSTYLAGGKGINVSMVLKELGIESTILGFSANFTGNYLKELLDKENLNHHLIEVDGFTRINVKIEGKNETAINTDTLVIKDEHLKLLKLELRKIKEGDYLIISGSLPKCLNQDFYQDLLKEVNEKVKVVVDTTDMALVNTLKFNPFLIKPNRYELEDIYNKKIESKDDLLNLINKLKASGARNVIVSMDKYGAILVSEDNKYYYLDSIKEEVKSTVGAGDSLVAGFIGGLTKGLSLEDAFKLGIAAASATTFSYSLGKKEKIINYYNILKERK